MMTYIRIPIKKSDHLEKIVISKQHYAMKQHSVAFLTEVVHYNENTLKVLYSQYDLQ